MSVGLVAKLFVPQTSLLQDFLSDTLKRALQVSHRHLRPCFSAFCRLFDFLDTCRSVGWCNTSRGSRKTYIWRFVRRLEEKLTRKAYLTSLRPMRMSKQSEWNVTFVVWSTISRGQGKVKEHNSWVGCWLTAFTLAFLLLFFFSFFFLFWRVPD